MASIAQANSYNSFIANSKALSIVSIALFFISFEDGVAELRDEYERVSTGTSLYDSTPL